MSALESLMIVAGAAAVLILLLVALMAGLEAVRRWAPTLLPTWIREELDREHAQADVVEIPWVAGCRGCEAASYAGRSQLARHQAIEHGIVRLGRAA